MVSAIRQFFEKYIKTSPESSDQVSEHSLQLATAALLIEMMRADAKVNEDERRTVTETVQSKFKLTEEETSSLLQLAEEAIWNSTGYYEFVSLINRGFAYEQKLKVIEHIWEVAFADAELDKHEEHMIRKIANLIYVSHKDFIEIKLRVRKKRLSR